MYFDPQGKHRKARTEALAYVEQCLALTLEPVNRSSFQPPKDQAVGLREKFLPTIREHLPALTALQNEASEPVFSDMVYRYYHGSFKVWKAQPWVARCTMSFAAIFPEVPLNGLFCEILHAGLREVFHPAFNRTWSQHACQVLDAAMHTRVFLEAVNQVARSSEARVPEVLSPNWGLALYLWNLR
jgi:hypothetical protein